MELHEKIFEISLSRLIFYPSNEPYSITGGFYDYGPIGKLIKDNIISRWREVFIEEEDNLEIETSLITPKKILEASGHVGEFSDPLVECEKCHTKIRADKLIEEKEGIIWDGKIESLEKNIKKYTCPKCGGTFGKIQKVNLMFETTIGFDGQIAFLRPETAQGIFTAFPRIFKLSGANLPLGIGQVGKSFRNEISPRKGLVRLREFTQAEFEYFIEPTNQKHDNFEKLKKIKFNFKHRGKNDIVEETPEKLVEKKICSETFAYYLAKEWEFFMSIGLDRNKIWFRHLNLDEMPHYSGGNVDAEVETSYGVIEIAGNAYRTNFDLSRHKEFSGKKDFNVKIDGNEFIPHVFEVSIGIDRTLFCILEHNFIEKGTSYEKIIKEWSWFKFKPIISPYKVFISPLLGNKEELKIISRKIKQMFKDNHIKIWYKEKGSIGKKYARADEIGIPLAVTIDFQSLEDETVTIRYRNSGTQERIKIDKLVNFTKNFISENK